MAERTRSFDVGTAFVYLRKWTLVSIVTGLIAGLGALGLILGIDFFTKVFLTTIVGYTPPLPAGETSVRVTSVIISRPWLIPLSTGLGGLISGLIVAKVAPEARGVGTDVAIGEFHKGHALIRTRVPLIKLLASAILIGSGGASGREGPVALIGAGLGTQVAKLFGLTERERRIALAAGLGAGIAAIFKAPLAGAILSGEVFYKHDFEAEAMIPGFVASTVSYSVVGFAVGWQPLFSSGINPVAFTHPQALLLYGLLGVLCALFAHLLFRVYYRINDFFEKLKVPMFVKPAIGGVMTGAIGIFVPSVLGVGYGWAQIALYQNYQLLPPLLLVVAIFGEIFAMSFTLGSGGSGGLFGPCVVTGTMIGGAFGYLAQMLFPAVVTNPSDFIIVGMMTFFAAAAKSPLAVIVMIAEMTGGYGLLAPSMVAVVVAYLLTGSLSVFYNQVESVEDSPAHSEEYETLALKRILVRDVMTRDARSVTPSTKVEAVENLMKNDALSGLPVVSDGRIVGIVTTTDMLKVEQSKREKTVVEDIMTSQLVTAYPEEDLLAAVTRMMAKGVGRLPVVSHDAPDVMMGIITRSDIARAIEQHGSHPSPRKTIHEQNT